MISYFGNNLIFNIIEYFIFINLLLVVLFLFYSMLFFIILNSSLLFSSLLSSSFSIELLITFFSFLFVIIIIAPGLLLFLDLDLLTSSSFIVYILGYQWSWNYTIISLPFINSSLSSSSSTSSLSFDSILLSSNLINTSSIPFPYNFNSYMLYFNNYLILSLFTSIKLYISSFDVIHSFGYHSLGFKSDAITGRINYVSSLYLLSPGVHYGYCYELCGLAHTSMLHCSYII